eukprot:3941615-Rhodomonas_salina.3
MSVPNAAAKSNTSNLSPGTNSAIKYKQRRNQMHFWFKLSGDFGGLCLISTRAPALWSAGSQALAARSPSASAAPPPPPGAHRTQSIERNALSP